jgi:uncharacterized phage protein (TIGR01671 family)
MRVTPIIMSGSVITINAISGVFRGCENFQTEVIRMREFKFRVWDKSAKRLVHSFEPSDEDQGKREYIPWVFGIGFSHWDKADISSIMQYSGLKDRKGKEIYEGDICFLDGSIKGDYKRDNSTVLIKFDEGAFEMFSIDGLKYVAYLSQECLNNRIEVIGNMYENPELFI